MTVKGKLRQALVACTFLLLTVCAVSLAVYSLAQVSDHSSTSDGVLSLDCSTALRPLQYSVQDEAESVACAWPGQLSASRIAVACLLALLPFASIYGLVRKKKWSLLVSALLCFVLAAGVCVQLYFDSAAVHASRQWCKDQASLECQYGVFAGLLALEAGLAVLWAVEGILLLLYLRKYVAKDFDEVVAFNWDEEHHGYETDDVPSNPYADARRAI